MFRKMVFPILLGIACVVFTVILSGSARPESVGALVDLPSFIITIIIPFLIVSGSFGLRSTKRAFSAPFDPQSTRRDLASAKAWFASFLRYVIAFAVFAFSVGFVMIMVFASGTDSAIIGKNFAIAILSVFYAAIIPIFIALPFQQAIDMRLAELE